MVKKIISGGQTGADRAGLFAAKKLKIATGGTAPKGWKTERGTAPWLEKYGLVECKKPGYPPRTALNIQNSDGTVIFGTVDPKKSRGTRLTFVLCSTYKKPCVHFDVSNGELTFLKAPQYFKEWLRKQNIKVLNVAGNSESKNVGIEKAVENFLLRTLGKEPVVVEERGAYAKRNDPETSHIAAATVNVSSLEQLVVDTLRANKNGLTAREVVDITGRLQNSINPRFAPLQRKGLIVDTGLTRKYKSKTPQIIWKAK